MGARDRVQQRGPEPEAAPVGVGVDRHQGHPVGLDRALGERRDLVRQLRDPGLVALDPQRHPLLGVGALQEPVDGLGAQQVAVRGAPGGVGDRADGRGVRRRGATHADPCRGAARGPGHRRPPAATRAPASRCGSRASRRSTGASTATPRGQSTGTPGRAVVTGELARRPRTMARDAAHRRTPRLRRHGSRGLPGLRAPARPGAGGDARPRRQAGPQRPLDRAGREARPGARAAVPRRPAGRGTPGRRDREGRVGGGATRCRGRDTRALGPRRGAAGRRRPDARRHARPARTSSTRRRSSTGPGAATRTSCSAGTTSRASRTARSAPGTTRWRTPSSPAT